MPARPRIGKQQFEQAAKESDLALNSPDLKSWSRLITIAATVSIFSVNPGRRAKENQNLGGFP